MNKTKRKILDIAIEMFKQNSYAEVTINDICKESDVSKHTFYYYFKSKEDLIRSSMMDFKDFENEVLQELALLNNPYEKYLASMRIRMKIIENLGPELTKILLTNDMEETEKFEVKEEIKLSIKRYRKMRISFLSDAQNNNLIKNKTDSSNLVSYHGAMIHGIVHRWAFSDGKINLTETIENATRSLFMYE